jgi:polar amino acid transport system substrate-binding protein
MRLRYLLFVLLLFSGGLRADVLESIIDRGTVRVGVSMFVPWTMKSESGQLYGFEVDVAKKIAEDIGVKPEFKVYEWEDILPALQKGEIDLIAAGMAITPARALKINFSRPYAESGVSMATNTKLTEHIKGLKELNQPGIVIAVVADTIGSDLARPLFGKAEVKAFRTREEAEKALLNGEAQAYLGSMAEINFFALQHPDKVDVPMSKPLLAYSIAFGVRKGEQEWLNFLDAWVTARQTDKWLVSTNKYWFNTLDWSKKTPE